MDNFATVPTETQGDRFKGRRTYAVPDPIVREALERPVTKQLLVTDAGFFPEFHRHGCVLPNGAREHIFMLCTAGSGVVRVAGAKHVIAKGDTALLPAGVPHEYSAKDGNPWTLWWFHMVGADADHLTESAFSALGGPVAHLKEVAPVASLMAQVIDNLDSSTNAGLVRASGLAWHILASVVANGKRSTGMAASPIDVALDYLQAISPRRASVEELAEMVGLGASQFSASFKQHVGVPPLRYQNDLRMARARELLSSTQMPVSDIALDCGYDDPLYFSRMFTRTHGHSPSSYRSQPK